MIHRRMMMSRAFIALLAVGGLVSAGSASANTSFGVVPQDGALPDNGDLKTMTHGGARTVRLMAHWPTVQPTKKGPYNWTTLDGVVREAVNHGVKPFFFFYGTP